MMVWNNWVFNFPSSMMMEYILILMDYTIMILIFVLLFTSLQMFNVVFYKMMDHSMVVNDSLEMVWSIIPFIILLYIAIPTLYCLYMLDSCNFCGLSLKVMGHQWYWTYYMPNLDKFMSMYMEQEYSSLRLIETDNSIMVPYNVPVRLMISSSDVIHSWTIPSLGLKMDAVPGRINSICFSCLKVGKFFGQCSEICGVNHSFMPISLESVNFKDYMNIN